MAAEAYNGWDAWVKAMVGCGFEFAAIYGFDGVLWATTDNAVKVHKDEVRVLVRGLSVEDGVALPPVSEDDTTYENGLRALLEEVVIPDLAGIVIEYQRKMASAVFGAGTFGRAGVVVGGTTFFLVRGEPREFLLAKRPGKKDLVVFITHRAVMLAMSAGFSAGEAARRVYELGKLADTIKECGL